MISLFIVFVSQYLGEQRTEKQGLDPEKQIHEAIRRLKRESSTSEIKQRRFERHLCRTGNSKLIKDSTEAR